jgi:proteasome accessory factor C
MDKWEKVVTFQRELYKNKLGRSLDHFKELFDNCDRSTVYRIKDLTELLFGIDIIYDKKTCKFRFDTKNGEITELPGLWFKKSELEALICLQHSISSLQHGYIDEVLSPFQSRFEPILKAQGVDIDAWKERFKILSIFTRDVKPKTFEIIADAVLHSNQVQILYRKLGQKEGQERIISPQTLVRYRDNWYVDTWCHLREELRSFSLNRIVSAKKLKEKSKIIPRKTLDEHFAESFGIFSGKVTEIAEILFTGTAAYDVSQEKWHSKQVGTWRDDNSYLLKVPIGNSTEIVMDVLRWGNEAEIIAPEGLRKEIAGILLKINKKYS